MKIVALAALPWRDIVLAKDPKLQSLYLESERAAMPARYNQLLRKLGLSAEQADKFDAAELAAAERVLDIKATAQAQGLSLTDTAVADLLKQSADQLQAAQADLLGTDGYTLLQQYERTLPLRGYVDELGGSLAFTGSPLTSQQADQLVQLLASASASYQNGGVAPSPRLTDVNGLMASMSLAQEPVDWDSVKTEAQSILSEPQFALLNAGMEENRTTIQVFNLMQRSGDAPLTGFWFGRKTH